MSTAHGDEQVVWDVDDVAADSVMHLEQGCRWATLAVLGVGALVAVAFEDALAGRAPSGAGENFRMLRRDLSASQVSTPAP